MRPRNARWVRRLVFVSILGLGWLAFGQTSLTPPSLSFGGAAVGGTSVSRAATFTNNQKVPVTISAIGIAGGNAPADYAWVGTCPISPNTLKGGANCKITVTFTPSAVGSRTGTLTVTSSATTSPQSVALTGTATAPVTVSPTGLPFASQLVGTTSAAKTITLTNHEKSALAISSIAASGDFAVAVGGCGSSVGAGQTCTMGVTFEPTAVGVRHGTLTISDNAYGGPTLISLQGTGNDAGLTSITVTPLSPSIAAGNKFQFTATGNFNAGGAEDLTAFVTWKSSTAGVATITPGGLATGVGTGTSSITATLGTVVSRADTLMVTAATLVSIAVAPANSSVTKGATQQFTATGTYSDSSTRNITSSVIWASSNPAVASIAGGLVTGVGTGASSITATLGSVVSPGDTLTVTPATLVSIAVMPGNSSVAKGTSQQFTATGSYSDFSTQNITTGVTWASSSFSVAISAGGLATGVSLGSSKITATLGGVVSPGDTLTVTPATLVSIAVTPASVFVGVGSTTQFTASGTYTDGSTSNLTTAVMWSSSNPAIAIIDGYGLAKSTGGGAAMLTATSGTVSGTATNNGVPGGFISCDARTVDMQVLVVTNGKTEADFPAITQALNYLGTPYTVLDYSQTGAIPSNYLSDGACHGYYQGVIFGFGSNRYNITNIGDLDTYEHQFNVRQVNWFVFPDPNFGLASSINSLPASSTPYNFHYAPAASAIFPYVNPANPVGITNAEIYLSSAANGSTPLLTDDSGNVLAALYNTSFAGQYLSLTFDSNQYLTHDLVLAYGLINWVTQGVFLGEYHVFASPQVDDFFIDDSEWTPGTSCQNPITRDRTRPDASNLPVVRVNAADMTELVAWQNGIQNDSSGLFSNFKLTMAFNGVGTAGNGDWTGLTAPITATSSTNDVATFTTRNFSGLPGAQVTVTGSTNNGGIFNGPWMILAVTSDSSTTPATIQFTATVAGAGTVAQQTETGATATIPDDLVANLQSYQGAFHWISHTYNHPTTLSGLHKSDPGGDLVNHPPTDDIDLEVLTNLWVASSPGGVNLDNDPSDVALAQLVFDDFNPANMVTPGVTGLNDTNVPAYLNADGIQYVVTDTSVTRQPNNGPNPSPNVGIVNSFAAGLYEVPRHPNDIYFNAANWNDDQAEFDCIYSFPTVVPPFNNYTAAQILSFVSSSFLNNMLIGDMDPEMFHQPDLHFSINTALGMPTTGSTSSLLTDTYDQTFTLYKQLYNLPVLSPTLDQLGQSMQNRNAYNLSNVMASIIGAGGPNARINITMPSTAVPNAIIPITGLNSIGAELYGGQYISHIPMTAGQSITVPAQ